MPTENCNTTLAHFGQCFLDTTQDKIGAVVALLGLIAPFWHEILNEYVANLPIILQSLSCVWIIIQIAFSIHRFLRGRHPRIEDGGTDL